MNVWWTAFIWIALALAASVVSVRLALSVALAEILFGVLGGNLLHIQPNEWVNFLAGLGGILLTFLAGAETDLRALRQEWKGAIALGFASFLAAFVVEGLIAFWGLGWSLKASLITGTALAPTSIAIVYTVLVDSGMNRTALGRRLLVACFLSNLAAMLTLGLVFAKPGGWFLLYVLALIAALRVAPLFSPAFFRWAGQHISHPHAKYLLLLLLFFSGLAALADTQAILAAYLLGLAMSTVFLRFREPLHQLRALAFSVFTPFYFLRAGTYVQASAFWNSLALVVLLLTVRLVTKVITCYPICRKQGMSRRGSVYASLIMSTGLTFDIIAAVFGLTHGYLSTQQYTLLLAVTAGSALIPTVIAQTFFSPSVETKPQMHTTSQRESSPAYKEG